MSILDNWRNILADHDNAPWVCPGCYAMGSEEHAGYCPDAAIERDHEEAMRTGDFGRPWDEEDEWNAPPGTAAGGAGQ